MIYKDNEQLRKYIDKILIDIDMSKVELSKRMNCKPQQLNNILNKKNLSFVDVARICNALDCTLNIDIVRNKDNE